MVISKAYILEPDPSRLVEGLRDTGYIFNTALADIMDNSLDANATVIKVNIDMDITGEVAIGITDNGCGMNEEELLNAMKYGSRSTEIPSRLGKFGLGLKTASTAFCRRIVVISRGTKEKGSNKVVWDLDHIAEVDKWELLFEETTEEEDMALEEITEGGAGTIVRWEKIDRLLKDYSDPGGTHARKALIKTIDEFKHHAAMVYQRFLDPEDTRAQNVALYVNGESVSAWDPFCKGEKGTEIVASKKMYATMPDGRKIEFNVCAYIIPRRDQFSNDEAAKMARLSNDMQGFYIYRENRLIYNGDYLGMRRVEPHTTLLRIEFTFDHKLDEKFNMDIKKSRVMLDSELYYWLQNSFLPAPINAADQRYRMKQRIVTEKLAKSAHDASNINIQSKEDELHMSDIIITNKETGQVEVTNKQGTITIILPIIDPSKPDELVVQPVDGIQDGLLWEPALIDGHHAVRINTGHPYYYKVYLPNLLSGVTIQGMDSLLWALSEAELGTVNQHTKQHFAELRFEVSRLLRRLVEDLPEAEAVEQLL